jgi:hypothetical protein
VTARPALTLAAIFDPVTSVTCFEPSSLNLVAAQVTIKIPHLEVSVNRRLALRSFLLLLLLWASVACSTKPTGENAEASATSHIFGSKEVYSNITRLTATGIFGRCVDLALKDYRIRSNLNDLLGEWDFPRLRRIGETLLIDLGGGDKRKGLQEVVRRGWASETDCDLFWETVNHGDTKSLGAHSALAFSRGKQHRRSQISVRTDLHRGLNLVVGSRLGATSIG